MKGEVASLLPTGMFAPEASGGHAVRKPKPTHVSGDAEHMGCASHTSSPTSAWSPTGDPAGAVSRANGRETLLVHCVLPQEIPADPSPRGSECDLIQRWGFYRVIEEK